jgi:hypothetical protein
MLLQGAHHGAQKSTKQGIADFKTSASNELSETSETEPAICTPHLFAVLNTPSRPYLAETGFTAAELSVNGPGEHKLYPGKTTVYQNN